MADTYLTRETLLKRLKSKDDDFSWEEFIHYYQRFIFSIINKMGVHEADSDDLFQKVMLKLWKSLPDFDYNQKQGQFRSWLYKVTQNTIRTFITETKYHLDKSRQVLEVSVDIYDKPEIEKLINEEWERHISALAFDSVKKKVSDQAMEVFLASLENEPVEETAKRLSLNESSIYVYRMRVKNTFVAEIKNLREMLE